MKLITPQDLQPELGAASAPVLLDVRLADDFEAAHLPGAVNNCVYEVAFTSRLAETAPDRDQSLVLCGADAASQEATMASEKLERLGYSDIIILAGGLQAWRDAGLDLVEGTPLPEDPAAPHGRHELDLGESRLQWLGRNLLNKHFGTIGITGGHLDFDQGVLTGGELTFNLQSIRCTDLDGDPLHDVLVNHLLDHDFLDAAAQPECRLVITGATPLPNAAPGTPNLAVTAGLTMRGVTEPIEFAAATGLTPEGKAGAQANFAIDRTRWGLLYGSSRFFNRLAGHLVNDLVEFDARIVTS